MNKENYIYNYSASEQEEITAIRNKYTSSAESEEMSKLDKLRQLDKSVTHKASVISLCMGIISAIVMGCGMSLIMTDLGDILSMSNPFVIGIIVGIIGMVGVLLTYPLYKRIVKAQSAKVAPEILKLTGELQNAVE